MEGEGSVLNLHPSDLSHRGAAASVITSCNCQAYFTGQILKDQLLPGSPSHYPHDAASSFGDTRTNHLMTKRSWWLGLRCLSQARGGITSVNKKSEISSFF